MNANLLISISGNGIARAICGANGAWQVEFPITGQDIRCLAADPRHPHLLFAGTQGQGVLCSKDAGKTWHPGGLAGRIVKSIAVSAHPGGNATGSGMVFAGTKSPASIFLSEDGGENWVELEAFRRIRSRWLWFSPAEPPFTAYVQGIALSPDDPNVLIAGIEAGAVVRSQDGGKTWSDHRPGAIRDCHTITFHATNGEWVYEGGGTGPAYSRDGGQTWRQPKGGLDRRYCWAVATDPLHPEVWYVSASPGPLKAHSKDNAQAYIYRSVGGALWEKLNGGLPQPLDSMPYALVTNRYATGHLYAGLGNGDVWFSEDYGDHWKKLPFNLSGIHTALLLITVSSDR
ncbi:MAG: WD40/YVTN/BNR-like repeat-containing protein [Omnitrophica WOR_2 bacterium]